MNAETEESTCLLGTLALKGEGKRQDLHEATSCAMELTSPLPARQRVPWGSPVSGGTGQALGPQSCLALGWGHPKPSQVLAQKLRVTCKLSRHICQLTTLSSALGEAELHTKQGQLTPLESCHTDGLWSLGDFKLSRSTANPQLQREGSHPPSMSRTLASGSLGKHEPVYHLSRLAHPVRHDDVRDPSF